MPNKPNDDAIYNASERLIAWLETQKYRGNDPHDALNSPLLGALGRRNRYVGIALVQTLRRSPINLRSLFRVVPGYNPKGMGLFLASFVRRYAALREPMDLERAHFFAAWLRDNQAQGYRGASWGYNFDWPNRGFFAPKGTPTIVNTAFNAQALWDYAQVCGQAWAFDAARAACEFILRDLQRYQDTRGICFSYTPHDTRYIHNANMLGAALLARIGAHTGERELLDAARASAAFTIAAQERDGSWKYGIGGSDEWVDNFHTGFVLGALADVIDVLGREEWRDALERGYAYWKENFFRADGAPKYYAHALYPIDVHAVAQAVITFLRMRALDSDASGLAKRTLVWGVTHMQDARGFFYYQMLPHAINRIPYIRWSNAWMLRAMAEWLWGHAIAQKAVLVKPSYESMD